MNIFFISKIILSVLWKGKTFLFGGLIYLLGHRAANQANKIKEQRRIVREDDYRIQLLQAMQKASDESPHTQTELLERLDKGTF